MKKERQTDRQTDRQTFRKLLVFFLISILAITLTPGLAFAADLPCGHKDTDPGDHSEADCYVPGHYNCDGKTHGDHCIDEYLEELLGPEDPNGPTGPTGPIGPDGPTEPPEPPTEDPPMPPTPPDAEPPTEIPIEIGLPDDGTDLDIPLKKKKVKEAEKKAVWAVEFKNCFGYGTHFTNPEWFQNYYYLNFKATKPRAPENSEEYSRNEDYYGDYKGTGNMRLEMNTTGLKLYTGVQANGGYIEYNVSAEGSLKDIKFDLSSITGDEMNLLKSEDPELYNMQYKDPAYRKYISAWGGSEDMTWNVTKAENFALVVYPEGGGADENPMPLKGEWESFYYIWVYFGGNAEILMTEHLSKGYVKFKGGRLSKQINGKEVK